MNNLPKISFEEFKKRWEDNLTDIANICPTGLRKGQYLMTLLNHYWKEEYDRLSSIDYYDETNIDCFYNDELIPNTLAHLEKKWFNYPIKVNIEPPNTKTIAIHFATWLNVQYRELNITLNIKDKNLEELFDLFFQENYKESSNG